MVKMSNNFKFFRPFKICYYLQLKIPNNNITHWFLKIRNKKMSCIPLLFHNNKLISNFGDKGELFNNFPAKQCTLIDNESEILPHSI